MAEKDPRQADYYKCSKCGKHLYLEDCPNEAVPLQCDMDAGIFVPQWFLRLKNSTSIFDFNCA